MKSAKCKLQNEPERQAHSFFIFHFAFFTLHSSLGGATTLPARLQHVTIAVLLQLVLATSVARAQANPVRELGGWVGAVAFQPEGKLLATGSSDGLVRLWDGATAVEIETLR